MNGNFIKFKHELRKYFTKMFQKDTLNNTTWSSRLPKDEINLMVERLCGYFENADNVEKFHKLVFFELKDYLGSGVKIFEGSEEWNKIDSELNPEIKNILED